MRPPPLNPATCLAQNLPTGQILISVFVLIVLIVVGGLVVIALRRKLLAKDSKLGHESGLMDEMRAMHARGELSDAEYDLIRKRLANRAAARLAEDPPTPPRSKQASSPRDKPLTKEAQKWLDQVQAEIDDEPPPFLEPRPERESPEPPEGRTADHDEDGFPKPR